MFLSKLELNPFSRQARRDIANPYDMHASLVRAFAASDEKAERFLWRLEPIRRGQAIVLVQSQSMPLWQELMNSEHFDNYFHELPQAKTVSFDYLYTGQVLRFRARVNPTVTKRHPDNPKKRQRVGLYKLEDLLGFHDAKGVWQAGWLEKQGQRQGFRIQHHVVADSQYLRFHKHDKKAKPITLQAVRYEGVLCIEDADVFRDMLSKGIGKAKALGFGLMSIAPNT